jgi:transitional endoplasmic reticulum ATPase
MTTTPASPEIAIPAWFDEYIATYVAGAAHGFILSGDVYGFTTSGLSQRSFLEAALSEKREVVIRYDRARGFSFPLEPAMREKAAALLESQSGQLSGEQQAMVSEINSFFGSQTMGVKTEGDNPFAQQARPKEALQLLERLLRAPKARGKVAVILDYAELICPSQSDKSIMSPDDRDILATLLSWGQDAVLEKCNNPIFLLVAQLVELHVDLRSSGSGYKTIDVPLPTRDERLAYIHTYLAKREQRKKPIPLLDLAEEDLANLAAGLNLRHIEDILLLAYRSGGVTRLLVKARKDAIITSEFSEIAEMIEPLPAGFAGLGGMDHLITWAKTELIAPLSKGGEDAPKGVLLVGPPGTGKTWFVKALAQEIGFNAVMLRSENILSKYVGESEAKLKRFFAFARALTPVLVFFDELDQSDMSNRGGESGNPVASNLFNQMLQFMSDESLRGKMVMFFASNRPDLIDAALLRFGRMDAIIPVLLPDEEGRRGIVTAQASSQQIGVTDEATALIAARTENYSAADIAAVVAKGKKLARRAGRAQIETQDAELALGYIRPATPQIARKYTLLAVQACNDAELLPPQYAPLLADRRSLDAEIRAATDERTAGATPREDRSW